MDWLMRLSESIGAESSTFEWIAFMFYKYSNMFIEGILATLYVAIIGTVLGFAIGLLVGMAQDALSSRKAGVVKGVGSLIIGIYVELFRGTPMIVQGMIVYYGLRQAGFEISPLVAGTIVMMLNTGAYMAETVRSGIGSISTGQREGAISMGVSDTKTMWFVILPQAIRNIMPEMCNTFLTNLKMTSVLNVIGVSELFYMAKTVGGTYYKYFEAYLVIALIYLVLCFVFSRVAAGVESATKGNAEYTLASEYM